MWYTDISHKWLQFSSNKRCCCYWGWFRSQFQRLEGLHLVALLPVQPNSLSLWRLTVMLTLLLTAWMPRPFAMLPLLRHQNMDTILDLCQCQMIQCLAHLRVKSVFLPPTSLIPMFMAWPLWQPMPSWIAHFQVGAQWMWCLRHQSSIWIHASASLRAPQMILWPIWAKQFRQLRQMISTMVTMIPGQHPPLPTRGLRPKA